jgi:hypothetical protein
MSLREEIGFLNKEQEAAGMPALDSRRRLQESDARLKAFNLKKKSQASNIPRASQQYGAGSGQIDPKSGKQLIM